MTKFNTSQTVKLILIFSSLLWLVILWFSTFFLPLNFSLCIILTILNFFLLLIYFFYQKFTWNKNKFFSYSPKKLWFIKFKNIFLNILLFSFSTLLIFLFSFRPLEFFLFPFLSFISIYLSLELFVSYFFIAKSPNEKIPVTDLEKSYAPFVFALAEKVLRNVFPKKHLNHLYLVNSIKLYATKNKKKIDLYYPSIFFKILDTKEIKASFLYAFSSLSLKMGKEKNKIVSYQKYIKNIESFSLLYPYCFRKDALKIAGSEAYFQKNIEQYILNRDQWVWSHISDTSSYKTFLIKAHFYLLFLHENGFLLQNMRIDKNWFSAIYQFFQKEVKEKKEFYISSFQKAMENPHYFYLTPARRYRLLGNKQMEEISFSPTNEEIENALKSANLQLYIFYQKYHLKFEEKKIGASMILHTLESKKTLSISENLACLDAYEELGEYDKCLSFSTRIIHHYPDSPYFSFRHGCILFLNNKKEEAIPYLLKSLTNSWYYHKIANNFYLWLSFRGILKEEDTKEKNGLEVFVYPKTLVENYCEKFTKPTFSRKQKSEIKDFCNEYPFCYELHAIENSSGCYEFFYIKDESISKEYLLLHKRLFYAFIHCMIPNKALTLKEGNYDLIQLCQKNNMILYNRF